MSKDKDKEEKKNPLKRKDSLLRLNPLTQIKKNSKKYPRRTLQSSIDLLMLSEPSKMTLKLFQKIVTGSLQNMN